MAKLTLGKTSDIRDKNLVHLHSNHSSRAGATSQLSRMGFFVDNPLIEFFHRIVRKPSTIMMWLFTSVIVASTTYLMFLPGAKQQPRPPSQDDNM